MCIRHKGGMVSRRGAAAWMLAAALALCTPTAHAEDCGFKTPAGIVTGKELMITDLSVVNDARALGPDGAWSLPHVFRHLAGDRSATGAAMRAWLESYRETFAVNGSTAAPRPGVGRALIAPWRNRDGADDAAAWQPDPAGAPFRLLAIVYRPDLGVTTSAGRRSAGEMRLVYTALDLSQGATLRSASPLPFTVIVEYALPVQTPADVRRWAERWHALGKRDFGEAYNQALADLTGMVLAASRQSPPRLRSNDGLDLPWQLREFRFDPQARLFRPAPVRNTPDLNVLGAPEAVSDRINRARGEDLPASLFAAAADVPDRNFRWPQMKIGSNLLRHNFAMLTCNGCHSAETGRKADESGDTADPHAGFRHISGRPWSEEARLSEFLTGEPAVVPDASGKLQVFCDLKLRQLALSEALALNRDRGASALPVARSRRRRID